MNPDASAPRFETLADDAWLIHFADAGRAASTSLTATSAAATNAAAHRFAARLRRDAPAWLRDVVPAYASLAVFFDPARIDADDARAWIAAQNADDIEASASQVVEIPVRYGGTFGEDLDAAAAELGMTAEALVARHREPLYTVAMIGFAPGFPYLSGLDPALTLPRLATPRTRVPAGSVGIGGAQTGIYPRESPGGWRLIGRTPLTLFDPRRPSPSVLAPGDRVRFVAIDDAVFTRLEREA